MTSARRIPLAPAAALAAGALLGLLLPLLAAVPAGAQQPTVGELAAMIEGPQRPDRGGLDGFSLEALMDELGVPGVSVAVIHDFAVHWTKGYGVADVETGAPVTPETLFQAASISKPVAAMAVLKAVQDGRFSLDDDINDILTSWTLPGDGFTRDRPVTPRTLTSHTSGLGDGFGFPGYAPGEALPTTVQILEGQAPSNVGRVFMERAPLTAMKYSGGGVTLMELALSDAVGRPFEAIAREWVLEPVGMRHSTFQQPLSPRSDRHAARAHAASGRAMGPKSHVYPELAAAGLWTTAGDLARFVVEVQTSAAGARDGVLSRTTVQEMLSPVGVGDYGVGFGLRKEGQGWYFQHGGSNFGFRALLVGHKAKGYGLVVMANGSRGGTVAQEILERVQRAYGWDALDKPVLR
ncbi:MAG: beta-lactamase family protein [Gemmatimonadetes bacterium]|nr:beta-lactamase family protein [Gemmatimonadota bacterium]